MVKAASLSHLTRSRETGEQPRFEAEDGAWLFYRHWRATGPRRGAVITVHRGHEHSARLDELARRLAHDGWDVFAPDMRGHGHSPGERGCAPSFAALVADLDCFSRHLAREHAAPANDCAVIGVSIGAVVAAAWAHDYAPPLRALALVAPAFSVRLYVPFALPALRLIHAARLVRFVQSYVRPSMLTHDAEQVAEYQADPLIFRQISIRLLLEMHNAGRRLVADAVAITCPTLVQAAGSDWVVKSKPQAQFFEGLSSKTKIWKSYAGGYHDLVHDSQRHQVLDDLARFLHNEGNPVNHAHDDLLHADQRGATHAEHQRLIRPLSILCWRRWHFAAARLGLATIGRLSAGIRLGWRQGFDSGQSLDYVYENRARGWTPLGRFIDRVYLNSVGWRGIRQRRNHLRAALDAAIAHASQSGRQIHIVDLAAGLGRYVLEALVRHPQAAINATLCDIRESELEQSRKLAHAMGLTSVVHERRDAFDRDALERMDPPPDIAIVSGLYELFPANAPVRASLAGLAARMRPGSLLIYTCQPWHPQLEFIARVLRNHGGERWIMRRRTQAEMDALAAAAGFRKARQWTGDDGIFTVSLAERVPTPAVQDGSPSAAVDRTAEFLPMMAHES